MFAVGDIITGTPENSYGITTRGMVHRVISSEDCDGDIVVKIIEVDEELLKESRSSFISNCLEARGYVGRVFVVSAKRFEYYEPKAEPVDLSSELIDFIDGM